MIGTIAQLIIGAALGNALLAGDASWLKFLGVAGLAFVVLPWLTPRFVRRYDNRPSWHARLSTRNVLTS